MADLFQTVSPGLDSPASKHFSITPSDAVDLAIKPRAIFIGTSGDVVIVDVDGTEITYVGLDGLYPFRAVRIKATGTTATGIVGIY